MALEIDTDLLNGLTAAYWKLVRWEIDTEIPRAYGEFKVYTDRNYAKIKRAASPLIAVVRLTGADFDGWFGSERDPKATDQAIFYAAAKALGVVSDFGPAPDHQRRGSNRVIDPCLSRERSSRGSKEALEADSRH